MRLHAPRHRRPGTVVPMLAVSIIALFALVALAIDIGVIALARNHSQSAADTAAMSAVRVLNGDAATNNNYEQAAPTATTAATANSVMKDPITASMVTTEIGYYSYDTTEQRFSAHFTGTKPDSESWSAVRVTISRNQPTFFARVIGYNSMPTSASAVAVHRPRDIALVLDFSGSMRFNTLSAYPYTGTKTGSLNPDPKYPKFGHWSGMASVLQKTSAYIDGSGQVFAPSNLTIETSNGTAVVNDFLMRDSSGNLVNAFVRTGSSYDPLTWAVPAPADWDVQSDTTETYGGASGKGGDLWPRVNLSLTTGAYAKTAKEFLDGDNTNPSGPPYTSAKSTKVGPGGGQFEPVNPLVPTTSEGYGPDFKGYSMGPGWYGKTFYMWPPDPRWHAANSTLQLDWRKKFFYNGGTTTALDGDNSRLWSTTTRQWRQASSSTYAINYTAVIGWIKAGAKVLPDNLRAGRVLYYTAIPDTIPATGGTEDQRFWRGYINYVIGSGSDSSQQQALYGRQPDSDSSFGTARITAKSNVCGADTIAGTPDDPYMHYTDNPVRPRLHFWFGPMSLLDFISRYSNNWLPGTCHESQCWQLKAGIQSALADIQKNHPNDWVGQMFFSNESDFTTARVKLGRDYTRMKNALFFPYSLLDSLADPTAEIRPYQNNDSLTWDNPGNIPTGTGGTAPEMGFKVAYNEFSRGTGYNGRRGAAKVLIFETDGVPNHTAAGSFTNAGAHLSYYTVTGGTTSYGNNHPTVTTAALDVVQTICNLETHATKPGYATPRTPVRAHAIGFGDLFQYDSTSKTDALAFLLAVQKTGSTSPSDATSIESYKIITGDYTTRIENLRLALERIVQSGVQVSLIR